MNETVFGTSPTDNAGQAVCHRVSDVQTAHVRVDGTHRCQCGSTTFSVDHRDLLKKYIRHVLYNEGVTYLSERYEDAVEDGTSTATRFDADEWAELQKLDGEIDHRREKL